MKLLISVVIIATFLIITAFMIGAKSYGTKVEVANKSIEYAYLCVEYGHTIDECKEYLNKKLQEQNN
jgi:hypothetical protein